MRKFEGVRSDAADEAGVALAQQAIAEGVETGNGRHTVPVNNFTVRPQRGKFQPGKGTSVARRPYDRADIACRERQAAWRGARQVDAIHGRGSAVAVEAGKLIDPCKKTFLL